MLRIATVLLLAAAHSASAESILVLPDSIDPDTPSIVSVGSSASSSIATSADIDPMETAAMTDEPVVISAPLFVQTSASIVEMPGAALAAASVDDKRRRRNPSVVRAGQTGTGNGLVATAPDMPAAADEAIIDETTPPEEVEYSQPPASPTAAPQ
jgi:hypothetical protein